MNTKCNHIHLFIKGFFFPLRSQKKVTKKIHYRKTITIEAFFFLNLEEKQCVINYRTLLTFSLVLRAAEARKSTAVISHPAIPPGMTGEGHLAAAFLAKKMAKPHQNPIRHQKNTM